MKANVLEAIFFDEHHNWDNFVEKHGRKIRLVVKREVNKFRYCGDIQKDTDCLSAKDVIKQSLFP